MKKRIIAVVAAACAVFSAAAVTLTNNEWKKDRSGSLSGSWSDPDHWSLGHEPTTSECAFFDNWNEDFTITVDDNPHEIGELELKGKSGDLHGIVLVGNGTVTIAVADPKYSAIKDNRKVVLDGASLIWTKAADCLLYGTLEVKKGSSFKNSRICNLWAAGSKIIVDGGSAEFSTLKYYDTSLASVVDVRGGTLKVSEFVGNSDSAKYMCPVNVAVSGGTATFGTFSLTRTNCTLTVSGGTMKVNDKLTIADGVSMSIADGLLDIGAGATNFSVSDNAKLALTGGTLKLNFDTSDRRFLETDGTGLDLTGHDLLGDGGDLLRGDTLKLGRFFNAHDATSAIHAKYKKIVFENGREPFMVGNDTSRSYYLEGPTVISASADMPSTCGTTWYAYFRGDFTVDTRDAVDGVTPRTVNLRHVHPEFGECSFDVLGGGTLYFLQAYSGDTFKSFTVRENTTLELLKRKMNSTEFCALLAERFTLGANATLKLTAKYNHVVSGAFAIDPTAKIEVTIPDDLVSGAFAILQSTGGIDSTPSVQTSQVTLINNEEKGFKVKAENGQITVYKEGALSEYPTEWTGLGADNKVNTPGNYNNSENIFPKQGETIYFGAGTARLDPTWQGPLYTGGYTVGQLHFLETAVETFTYTGKGETLNTLPSIVSYSGVPQRHVGAKRTVGLRMETYGSGPLVFSGDGVWGKDYADNHFTWTSGGDCRIAIADFKLYDFNLNEMQLGVTPFSRFTVLNGSKVDITRMKASISAARAGFRVEAGGTLSFTDYDGTQVFRVSNSNVAKFIVNGTMDIQIPFKGAANQTYGGSGTLKIAAPTPDTAAARVRLADTLTTELSRDWNTVTATSDNPMSLTAIGGTPTLKVPSGWRYGAATGVNTASSAASRALEVAEGATLTIDAGNGPAIIDETVVGDGTLAMAAGTSLKLTAAENAVKVLVASGSTFDVGSDMMLGGLATAAGATLSFAKDAVLTVAGDVSLAGSTLAFPEGAPRQWTTIIACPKGEVTLPADSDVVRTRIVEIDGVQVVQAKGKFGFLLFMR